MNGRCTASRRSGSEGGDIAACGLAVDGCAFLPGGATEVLVRACDVTRIGTLSRGSGASLASGTTTFHAVHGRTVVPVRAAVAT